MKSKCKVPFLFRLDLHPFRSVDPFCKLESICMRDSPIPSLACWRTATAGWNVRVKHGSKLGLLKGKCSCSVKLEELHGVTRDNFPWFCKLSTSQSLRPTLPFLLILWLAYVKTGTVQRCKCSKLQACIFICLLMLGPSWWWWGGWVLTQEKCSILMLTQRCSCKRCCAERELPPACD